MLSKIKPIRRREMHIRFFTVDDTESTADLLHDMSVHYNGGDASSREAVRANLVENILGANSGVRLVVALQDNRVVGLAAISLLHSLLCTAPKEQAQLFMKELYVHSLDRGAGIGERLMSWLARYALDNQCVRFDWTVDETNTRARRFYDELGAAIVKEKLYFRVTGASLIALAGGDVSDHVISPSSGTLAANH
jgi:GNAT superfamily N-acetyltransferase